MALANRIGQTGITVLMGAFIAVAGLGAYLAQEYLAYERPQIEIDLATLPPHFAQAPIIEPDQVKIPRQTVDLGQGFVGQIHHRYQVAGIVLTRQDFTHDGLAPVSPLDLGIGWGPLLDPAERARYTFSTGRRMIQWRPVSRDTNALDLVPHLANNHLLPGSEAVRAQLLAIAPGMAVHLTGYLIDVTTPDGRRWRSSTRRTDYNFRGCEVILVTEVRVLAEADAAS